MQAEYISKEVRELLSSYDDTGSFVKRFFKTADAHAASDAPPHVAGPPGGGSAGTALDVEVVTNLVRQSPQYTLAAIRPGVYLLGMKDQFNIHDLPSHPMAPYIEYVADEAGFILFDRTDGSASSNPPAGSGASAAKAVGGGGGGAGSGTAASTASKRSVDSFGPYFIEQYLVMEVLSKQEVAQNVLEYYVHHKEKLQRGVESYEEAQGKGFICWRFINEFRQAEGRHAMATPR